MAMSSNWIGKWDLDTVWTSASTTLSYPMTTSTGTGTSGLVAPVPRHDGPFDWLDRETEAICELARQVAA